VKASPGSSRRERRHPLGTAFQYCCTGDEALVFTCTAMPPWPGDEEAVIVDGPWAPRANWELGGLSSDQPVV
jgi:hypothetical protein